MTAFARTLSHTVLYADSALRGKVHLAGAFACNFANHCFELGAGVLRQAGLSFDLLRPLIGEMTAKGVNTKGLPWHIGINKPVDDSTQTNNEIQQIIELSDRRGIATSGDYRNFYVRDGKKYAHTINPKTGYPAAADILSATIMAEDCIVADAYATSCMALGRKEAKRLLARHPELDYFFIYADSTGAFRTEWSEGMEKYLVK